MSSAAPPDVPGELQILADDLLIQAAGVIEAVLSAPTSRGPR
jgi:hypothetical protein